MAHVSIKIEENTNQPMAWINPVLDGKASPRMVNSWEEIDSIAKSNGCTPNQVIFPDGVADELDRRWGKPKA